MWDSENLARGETALSDLVNGLLFRHSPMSDELLKYGVGINECYIVVNENE